MSQELKVLYDYRKWKYCPSKSNTFPYTVIHNVLTPKNILTVIPYVDNRRADPSHFNRWVDLGAPSFEEMGFLIKTKHHLRMYARKVRIKEILEELGDDMPPPSKFGLKEYTNLNLLKKIRRTKIEFNCGNSDLPVLIKLLQKD